MSKNYYPIHMTSNCCCSCLDNCYSFVSHTEKKAPHCNPLKSPRFSHLTTISLHMWSIEKTNEKPHIDLHRMRCDYLRILFSKHVSLSNYSVLNVSNEIYIVKYGVKKITATSSIQIATVSFANSMCLLNFITTILSKKIKTVHSPTKWFYAVELVLGFSDSFVEFYIIIGRCVCVLYMREEEKIFLLSAAWCWNCSFNKQIAWTRSTFKELYLDVDLID